MFSEASLILSWQGSVCLLGGVFLLVAATEAGGTHPTGMHSCYRRQTEFAKR